MKIARPIATALLLAALGCGARPDSKPDPKKEEPAKEDKPAAAAPAPAVRIVGKGTVARRSDAKDADGNAAPPWKAVEIVTIVGFTEQPKLGDRVTVVPENGDPAFDLAVTGTKERRDVPGEVWWEVDVEPVKEGPLFTAKALASRGEAYPCDVVVLYPAVAGAKRLDPAALAPGALPPDAAPATVLVAADLNADGAPDAVYLEFCCGDRAKSIKTGCDYHCSESYIKDAGGWKRVGSSMPL